MSANDIVVRCVNLLCPKVDRVPARKRTMDSKEDDVVPIATHPYVCADCWRNGWRAELKGDKEYPTWSKAWTANDPTCSAVGWKVYQLPNHPQSLIKEKPES